MDSKELMERLANAEHSSWSKWMNYLFSKCKEQSDGSMLIPINLVGRWQRQARTPYAELTEVEKQSDRNEVEYILPIIERIIPDDVKVLERLTISNLFYLASLVDFDTTGEKNDPLYLLLMEAFHQKGEEENW